MIPLVPGFSDPKAPNSTDNLIYGGNLLSLLRWIHPFGNVIYLKQVGHWASNGLRNCTRVGGETSLMGASFRRPVHPNAVLASIVEGGFVKFEQGTVPRDEVDEYHCRVIANMPEWDILARRLPYGEITSREFTDVFPEAIQQGDASPVAGSTDIDMWPMDPAIAAVKQQLVEASVDERVELLKELLYTGSPPSRVEYAKPATMFMALDEDHWYPVFLTVTKLTSGTTFAVHTNMLLPGEVNLVVYGHPGGNSGSSWPLR